MSNAELFDPYHAFQTLIAHGVRFVVIGGIASRAWGSPTLTSDIDICYDRAADNLDVFARALHELRATLRGAPLGLPFILDARTLAMGDSFTFNTTAGMLDCLGTPAGTSGYADLAKDAIAVSFEDLRILVASLDDVMRMKRAAGRPKDHIELEVLEALKEERERQPPTSES